MKLDAALQLNYGNICNEWAYTNISPLIMVEPLIKNSTEVASLRDNINQEELEDLWTYKFLCFDGEPRIMYVTVKNEDVWENYYDMNFNLLDIKRWYRQSKVTVQCPLCWEDMKRVAKILSAGIPHVRVDLYVADNHVKFSEMAFYDWAGLSLFPEKWEKQLGDWIILPNSNKS